MQNAADPAPHPALFRPNGAAAAYGAVIRGTESPRDIEYRVLSQATGLLQAAMQPDAGPAALAVALHENRAVWTAMISDLASPGNSWDDQGKARLFSLARWVLLECDRVQQARGTPAALIEVNLIVMQGLKPAATGSVEAA